MHSSRSRDVSGAIRYASLFVDDKGNIDSTDHTLEFESLTNFKKLIKMQPSWFRNIFQRAILNNKYRDDDGEAPELQDIDLKTFGQLICDVAALYKGQVKHVGLVYDDDRDARDTQANVETRSILRDVVNVIVKHKRFI